jgi:F0F1-type ATP synthase membrane subunit c/vacuolar-type H+-ATPase subunit K
MEKYREDLGRARIVAGLLVVAVLGAVLAQGQMQNRNFQSYAPQPVVVDATASAVGE